MKLFKFLAPLLALALSTGAFGHDHDKMMKSMTPEHRAKMATMFQKMADCLKDTSKDAKTPKQCHEEMEASCPMSEDGEGCPMMGHHSEHGGKMGGHMHHDKKDKAPEGDAPAKKE